ncbi:putative ubiquitin thioesterase [Rosellinia necatrix]|uniref:ubiquitinyl hydrolase 1 n=1 Tax=Rosellinia necatrix TaxID=77044 RepID=A0A1W2TF98_ROSNE|nr:putative ubiquitin thioesterase [Rosellinia necatrix]
MGAGSKLAQQEQESGSHSGSPAGDTGSSSITDVVTSVGIDTDTSTDRGIGIGIGIGIGMFQPQPTPFPPFLPYGLHVANAGIPEYAFAPTPLLGQFGGGHVGANTARNSGDAGAVGEMGSMSGMGGMGMSGMGGIGGIGGIGAMGAIGARGGSSNAARGFAAAPNSNFHASASTSGGPAGMGVGLQGLGSSAVAASASDNSAGYSSSGGASIHPCLYDVPIPVSVPHQNHHHHHPSQHQQPQHHQNQQQPQSRQQQQQQQQQQQHQRRRQNQHPHLHPSRQNRPHLAGLSTNRYKMDQMELDPTEIAQQDATPRDYEPQFEGPLVGEKVSSHAIAEEYATADPTYVAKTMALPQTYSHYRSVRGDGNCGWRAIAFAYFETLVQCGNVDLVRNESQRMTGLIKYIEDAGGQDPTMFEFMVEETMMLLSDIILAMSEGSDPMPNVINKFNDPDASQCIVYHLRLLACAKLKGNSAQYQGWLDGGSVQDFLDTTVMPVNREIDHMCITLLCDILLAPANIVLEIAYLDRSEGDKVNVHRFTDSANGQDPSALGPVIYLLYRPGHYDILYRETIVSPPPAPVDLQVHRVDSFTHHRHDFEDAVPALQDTYSIDMSALSIIPGLASTLPFAPSFAPSPASWVSQSRLDPEVLSAPPPSQPSPPQQQATVRFSKWNFPNLPGVAAESSGTHEPAFTTNTFKNSHYNTAHYNNTNFQPEMYHPGAEEEIPNNGNCKTGGRKRSTEHCPGIKKEK